MPEPGRQRIRPDSQSPARSRNTKARRTGESAGGETVTTSLKPEDLAGLGSLGPEEKAKTVIELQRRYGNQRVQRMLARYTNPESPKLEEDDATGNSLSTEISERIENQRGAGKALDPGTRDEMEASFDHGFGGVRVHTGPEADTLNQDVQARAFTTGQDIFFRSGTYSPGSAEGKELLAHELTHVVQQGDASASGPTRVTSPDDATEIEAATVAKSVVEQAQVARQEEEEPLQMARLAREETALHQEEEEPLQTARLAREEPTLHQEEEEPLQMARLAREEPTLHQEEEEPKDKDTLAELQAVTKSQQDSTSGSSSSPSATFSSAPPSQSPLNVRTVLRPGQPNQTTLTVEAPHLEPDSPAHSIVAPGGGPTVGSGSNDCTPSTASAVLAWDVIDEGTNWKVNVTSLTLAGQLNVKPWPSSPTSMVVPNTPNPVDGGNINNTAGSPNHWQAAINDMADYHTAGSGGAGPNWHSTAASSAHEWAHWNTDYVADSVNSAAGGNWPQTNADLDALTEPKTDSATVAEARIALEPRVNARMATWRSATIARWNAIPDSPGVAGSTGYDAGMAVLNTLIAAVQAYKDNKGW